MTMRYFFCLIFFLVPGISDAQYVVNKTDSAGDPLQQECRPDSCIKTIPTPFHFRQLYVPATLIATGIVSATLFTEQVKYKIVAERNQHLPDFRTSVDNYLQYAPIPIVYGLDALGFKARNDVLNRSLILLKGEALMFVTVNILKQSTKERRPDGSNLYSFPSGHTAQAFAAATFLSEEYKTRYTWMPYLAYSMAGTTGLLRMANNRHFISDVLMGAGLGILSMKASYWTHQYRWGKKRGVRMIQM